MDFAGTTTHYSEVELSMLLEALMFFPLEMICSCSQLWIQPVNATSIL